MKAIDIIWDVDNFEDKILLPSVIEIPDIITSIDQISEYISDVTGFCHYGFKLSDL